MFIKMQHCKRNRLPFSVAIVHFQGLGFVKVRAEVGLSIVLITVGINGFV